MLQNLPAENVGQHGLSAASLDSTMLCETMQNKLQEVFQTQLIKLPFDQEKELPPERSLVRCPPRQTFLFPLRSCTRCMLWTVLYVTVPEVTTIDTETQDLEDVSSG
jgi:hypothetical protein